MIIIIKVSLLSQAMTPSKLKALLTFLLFHSLTRWNVALVFKYPFKFDNNFVVLFRLYTIKRA